MDLNIILSDQIKMIKNIYLTQRKPKRVVIFGGGFIANSLVNALKKQNVKTKLILKKDINLIFLSSTNKIIKLLKKDDTVIFIAAKAPVKSNKMLIYNLKICKIFCNALNYIKINHLVYISSDAVYKDSKKLLNEKSIAQPDSLHGLMHYSREQMLKNSFNGHLCIVRPTLIYGMKDPHNGYGPNMFIRNAIKNKNINIYGMGEELRDHIHIDDVANLISKIILYKSIGYLNLASGKIFSFLYIAKKIIKYANSESKIIQIKRTSPMPHGGYRAFDTKNIKKLFPKTTLLSINKGLSKIFSIKFKEY